MQLWKKKEKRKEKEKWNMICVNNTQQLLVLCSNIDDDILNNMSVIFPLSPILFVNLKTY